MEITSPWDSHRRQLRRHVGKSQTNQKMSTIPEHFRTCFRTSPTKHPQPEQLAKYDTLPDNFPFQSFKPEPKVSKNNTIIFFNNNILPSQCPLKNKKQRLTSKMIKSAGQLYSTLLKEIEVSCYYLFSISFMSISLIRFHFIGVPQQLVRTAIVCWVMALGIFTHCYF